MIHSVSLQSKDTYRRVPKIGFQYIARNRTRKTIIVAVGRAGKHGVDGILVLEKSEIDRIEIQWVRQRLHFLEHFCHMSQQMERLSNSVSTYLFVPLLLIFFFAIFIFLCFVNIEIVVFGTLSQCYSVYHSIISTVQRLRPLTNR